MNREGFVYLLAGVFTSLVVLSMIKLLVDPVPRSYAVDVMHCREYGLVPAYGFREHYEYHTNVSVSQHDVVAQHVLSGGVCCRKGNVSFCERPNSFLEARYG